MAAIQFSHISVLTFVPTCLFLFFFFSCNLCPVGSVAPVMKPPTIESSNKTHSADASSNIKWGNVPAAKPIDLSDPEKSDGLEPLFKFSRTFIYSTLNSKLPIDLIKRAMKGQIDLIPDMKNLILDHIGLLVTIIVGILFVVLFPIIGFCFCLCRCCGKCGGKMIQPRKERSPFRRKVLSFLLFAGVAFSASGTAFMFASDARLMDNIKRTPDVLPQVMKAIAQYGDNVFTEIEFMSSETVTFLLDVIKRDLDNLDVLVGVPLQERLDQNASIKNIFTTAKDLSTDLGKLETFMKDAKSKITDVKNKATTLDSKMNTLKSAISNDINSCNCGKNLPMTNLDSKFSPNQLPDISAQISNIANADLAGKIKGPEKEFDDIPNTVKTKSAKNVQDVKKMLDKVQSMIPKYLTQAKTFKTDLDAGKVAGQDLGALTNQSSGILKEVEPYNKIRSYAFIGLAGFCLFIVGLLFFGLLFGFCGHDDTASPVHRGCASNCGGCMIMGGVVLIFLFGWLLMLLTTVMFIPGAVSEVYGCKTLREIGQGSVDKILEDVLGKNLGEMLFHNKSYNVKISGLYNGCERGEGVYQAANLNYIVNLDSIFNYPEEKNVKKDITSINVDLSTIKIMTPDMKTQLANSKNYLNINFNTFYAEIAKVPTAASLSTLILELETIGKSPTAYAPKFVKHAKDLEAIQNNEMKQLTQAITSLKPLLKNMETSTNSIKATMGTLEQELNHAQNVVKNKGNEIVSLTLKDFADRILGIWADFVKYVKDLLDHKIGKCRPIVKIYDYVIINTLCGMVDSFNAYWFGLGWCLFFLLFNLIVGVKLAKFFRRMSYSDELDGSHDVILPTTGPANSAKNGIFPQNKVGQMPRY